MKEQPELSRERNIIEIWSGPLSHHLAMFY